MTRHRARGSTILEAMLSMAVLVIGAAGLMGTHTHSMSMLGGSQRMGRATEVAEDLMAQIETWDFDDPRLADDNRSNDADLGDSAGLFLVEATPPFDHDETHLTMGGRPWNGLPVSAVRDGGLERYWNVSDGDDFNGNGVPDALRVAVIVRWQQGSAFRRVVFVTVKPNPGDAQ